MTENIIIGVKITITKRVSGLFTRPRTTESIKKNMEAAPMQKHNKAIKMSCTWTLITRIDSWFKITKIM